MGTLWSWCGGTKSEGIANEPLVSRPDVHIPSNLSPNQYNNLANITLSLNRSVDGPERNGSLRQIDFPHGTGRSDHANAQISGYSTSLVEQRQNEEATALQDVLNEMANNVFDLNLLAALAHAQPGLGGYQGHANVSHLHSSVVEPSYVQERAQDYGRRLQRAGHNIALKAAASFSASVSTQNVGIGGLADLGSHAEVEKAIFSETLSDNDAMLIAEVSARAQEAFKEFKIEHCENLVVQFGQQQTPQYSHGYGMGQQSIVTAGMT